MISLFSALTANGTLSASGIKNLKVFYDTLLINIKAEQYDVVILENLNFNYDSNIISSSNSNNIINFGNTFFANAHKTIGTGYFDTVLLEKEKILLICGLNASRIWTKTINNQTHTGRALIPCIWQYDLNSHDLKPIYNDSDVWANDVTGNITMYSDVAVSYNTETNILNYIIKATRTVNSATFYFWTDIEFTYSKDQMLLSSVRSLSSLANNNYSLVSFRNYNDGEKVLVTANNDDFVSFSI